MITDEKLREKIFNEIADKCGLRTYQKDCAGKVVTCFLNCYSTDFLISACCRYGKTTTALAICKIIAALYNIKDLAICVVSGMPGSVKSSWRDDAYRLGFINNKDIAELDIENLDFTQTSGIHVTFISTQKLGNNTDKDGNLVEHSFIKEYKEFFNNHLGLKILIQDEAHNAFGTDRILEALSGLKYDYKLELTATPYTIDLIKNYELDTVSGDVRSYFFSQIDMLKLYDAADTVILKNGIVAKTGFTYIDDNGEEKPWRPVKPVVIIEDIYQKLYDEGFDFVSLTDELKSTAFVSAYFKVIFSDTKTYKKYCDIFIKTYILGFANKYNIKNILAFVTMNDLGNRIAAYINQNFSNEIYAKSLADQNATEDETSVDKANNIFEQNDNKIHFVLTCRKCGTGSSMPLLNATMFLKGVVNYSEYRQFSARAYNPNDGKEFGYTIMFSPDEALQMIAQHANSEKHEAKEEANLPSIDKYLQYIKVFVDGTELVDATELMNKLDTIYRPNQTILFPSLDLETPEILCELAQEVIKSAKFKPRQPQTPKDPDDNGDSSNGSKSGSGKQKDPATDTGEYTKESLRKAFQDLFVSLIADFYQDGYTEDDIKAINENSSRPDIRLIEGTLCTMKLWNILRTEYFDKVLHKVYVYVKKVVIK